MPRVSCDDGLHNPSVLKRRLRWLVLGLMFIGNFAAADTFAQYRFEQFTTNNGLPQNTVNAIAQTRDGYLWFATFDGLVRYDGIRFTVFDKGNSNGITSNRFVTLCEDLEGTLWAGTVDGGLIRYRDGAFTAFTTEQGLPRNHIAKLQLDENGALMISVNNETKKLTISTDGRFSEIPAPAINEFTDHSKARWIWHKDNLVRIRNRQPTVFSIKLASEEFFRYRYEDRAGNLWLGTDNNGVYQISDDTVTHHLQPPTPALNFRARVGGEDHDGNLWVFDEQQLYRYRDGKLTPLLTAEGVTFKPIRAVFCDREGIIWVGTDGHGMYRVTRQFLNTYSMKDGLLENNVYPIYEDRAGHIWIGTLQKGFARLANGKFTNFSLAKAESAGKVSLSITRTPDPNVKINVDAFYQDNQGRLWIGVGGGLLRYADNKFEDFSYLLNSPLESTEVILQDREGNLWFGTTKGLFKMQNGQIKLYMPEHGLPNHAITAIHEDKQGNLWVGTREGLAKRQGDRFIPFTAKDGLAGNRIRSIYEDRDGALWIGTFDSGLSRLKDGRFTNYTVKNGLFNNGVFQILEDRQDNFWISCNRGIYRVGRRQLNDFADGKIALISCVAYNGQDGMRSPECNGGKQPAGTKTRDGRLWFPTQGGVVVIDPEVVIHNSQPPVMTIESVNIEGRNVNFKSGVAIEPYQTDLEINYAAPSSIKAEAIHFKYKLEGLSDEWIDAGTRRSVHYSQLPPGHYLFKVIAANSDGVWNETGVALEIHMKPFFYQTRLFIAMWLMIAFGIGIAIYVWRVRQLKATERKLTQVVAQRTAQLVERTQQLETANEKLAELATLDGLTNIANRRRFKEFLAQEWQRAGREQTKLSLLLMDVDYFKPYNDTYGHQSGDECLKQVARVLSDTVKRTTDLAARYGGEEFVVVLSGTDEQGASVVAERIRAQIELLQIPHRGSKVSDHVTISIGVATFIPDGSNEAEELIAAADEALYQAKENGRNRIFTKTEVWV
ncbi:MAG: diguanylate cyclase [Acidobacteriota bacterium]